MSSRVRLEFLHANRWRVSVTCYTGKIAAVEGDLATVGRLATRAERLFEYWARSNALRTTAPPPRATVRPREARSGTQRLA
jgi:hypothetical protein